MVQHPTLDREVGPGCSSRNADTNECAEKTSKVENNIEHKALLKSQSLVSPSRQGNPMFWIFPDSPNF